MEKTVREQPVVLYVDDISANLMLFEATFESDFRVLLAASGDEALDVLKEHDVSVIVSDQNMPGMSGNELLEKVSEEYPQIMRFMITAYTDYEIVVDAVNKGKIYGFFNKPYNADEVRMAIRKSLEVRELRLKNQEMLDHLSHANEQLLHLDRSRNRFLAKITNEIRNPINRIITAIHMLKDKIDSSEITELLHLLDISVSRLENFTFSADQLMRMRDDGFTLESSEVLLREIVDMSVIEKQQLFRDEQVAFRLEEEEEQLFVKGQHDLLIACFNAMLDYCVLHSEPGSELVFKVALLNGNPALSILHPNCLPGEGEREIIEQYFKEGGADGEENVSMELILAQQIMKVHNGRVSLKTGESGAIVFSMEFPERDAQ